MQLATASANNWKTRWHLQRLSNIATNSQQSQADSAMCP
jgi:hypothetical protein